MKEICMYFRIIVYTLACNVGPLTADHVSREDAYTESEAAPQDSFNTISYSPEWQPNWPNDDVSFGQPSGVSLDGSGRVHLFHRGDRQWNAFTFDPLSNVYTERSRGPIAVDTVLVINATTGRLLYSWGKNLFYMPHGITVDQRNDVWVTDVALHQVFRFTARGKTIVFKLGEAFVPGSDDGHFCKPTSVAVMTNGDFFVADGYCNNRILKYSSGGTVISRIGAKSTFPSLPGNYQLAIPHGLTLVEPLNEICVADRENGRVMCYDCHNSTFVTSYKFPVMGEFLYSVAYAPVGGGKLYVINFPSYKDSTVHVRGFVIDIKNRSIESQFGPSNNDLQHPHDIAVSRDGTDVYVIELQPFVVHKFSTSPNLNLTARPAVISEPSTFEASTVIERDDSKSTSTTIIILIAVLVVVGTTIIGAVAVISKLRKRGCILVPSSGRKQQWEVSSSGDEGFKLSHLLDRHTHPGFEKLNTEESDEDNAANA